jgi:hypothetical protein
VDVEVLPVSGNDDSPEAFDLFGDGAEAPRMRLATFAVGTVQT